MPATAEKTRPWRTELLFSGEELPEIGVKVRVTAQDRAAYPGIATTRVRAMMAQALANYMVENIDQDDRPILMAIERREHEEEDGSLDLTWIAMRSVITSQRRIGE